MTGKRKLVMALTAVLALTGGISGQAAFSNTLDEVIVTAEKDQVEAKVLPGGFEREETSFGLTGEQDIMTVPYTAQSISAKSIEMMAAPTGQIGQVLTNVPSIRTGTSLDLQRRSLVLCNPIMDRMVGSLDLCTSTPNGPVKQISIM